MSRTVLLVRQQSSKLWKKQKKLTKKILTLHFILNQFLSWQKKPKKLHWKKSCNIFFPLLWATICRLERRRKVGGNGRWKNRLIFKGQHWLNPPLSYPPETQVVPCGNCCCRYSAHWPKMLPLLPNHFFSSGPQWAVVVVAVVVALATAELCRGQDLFRSGLTTNVQAHPPCTQGMIEEVGACLLKNTVKSSSRHSVGKTSTK